MEVHSTVDAKEYVDAMIMLQVLGLYTYWLINKKTFVILHIADLVLLLPFHPSIIPGLIPLIFSSGN